MTLRATTYFDSRGWLRTTGSVRRRAENPRPIFEAVVEDYHDDYDVAFKTRNKGRWRKNAKSWAAEKRRTGHGDLPLVYTGGLRDSFVKPHDRYGIERFEATKVTVGSKNPLGNLQMKRHGGKAPRDLSRALTPVRKKEWKAYPGEYITTGRITRRRR